MFAFFLLAIVVLILFFARLPFFLEVLWFIWRVASVLLMWLSVVLPRSMQFIFYKKCPPYFHDIFDEMVALVKNKGFTLTGAHLRQPRFWFWFVAFPCWITVYAYAFRPLPLVVISDLSDLSGRFMFVVMAHELGHLIDF